MSIQKRGELKIFLGYAAGVGKTYAMLKDAKTLLDAGRDIIIGYVEPHDRKDTKALTTDFEIVPTIDVPYNNRHFSELDLNAIIQRSPEFVIIDELAHTNIPGLRHPKRYGDIEELLNLGISVYTTLNIQHIESLHDVVEEITQVKVRERIPDSIVDEASQIKLVDIEPTELIERLINGQIYAPERVNKALNHFFTKNNLVALREITLRRIADTIHLKTIQKNVAEHILVGISSSPTNAKVIRTAARLSQALHAKFTCLYVLQGDRDLKEADEERLQYHMKLAQQLGGLVVTVQEDDIANAMANYAQISGVTKLVIGRTMARPTFFNRLKITDRISEMRPDLAMYIVPDEDNTPKQTSDWGFDFKTKPIDLLKMLVVFFIVSLIGKFFQSIDISDSNIITIYILGVLVVAIWTTGWLMNIISSILAVLIFNFLFTTPMFSFEVYHRDYPMTFIIMFAAAIITSSLMKRVKKQQRLAVQKSYRVETLLETNRKLQAATSQRDIINTGANELIKITEQPILFYALQNEQIFNKQFCPSASLSEQQNSQLQQQLENNNEYAIALWVLKNKRTAGQMTDVFKDASAYYIPMLSKKKMIGIIAISLSKKEPLPAFEKQILHAMINDWALAYEKWFLLKLNEDVRREKELEKIQSNLLRAISHDLRTPLTSISGHADILRMNNDLMSAEQQQVLYEDIYYNANRLVQLVENLLAVSKLSNGSFPLQIQEELVEDVVLDACEQVMKNTTRKIDIHIDPPLLTASMDTRLIGQVIVNLLDNAINYTADDCTISLHAGSIDDKVFIEVRDNGKGIPTDQKREIFQSFKEGRQLRSDSKRGLGIGLALCQTILQLHDQEISVADNAPSGTIFRFTLEKGASFNG